VDVLLTMDGRGDDKGPTAGGSTVTLVQNVEVLAIEQRVVAPAESKLDPTQLKSVTLLVSPRDASKLNLGHSKGRLHLSLRNLSDTDVGLHSPIFARELLGDGLPPEKPEEKKEEKKAEKPPAPPEPFRIRTLRGTTEGEVLIYPGRR
jgi:pilus assembly protein CpaB